ncbi:cupin domain-containing protein [Allopusillimonas ginsengisoli]|uniref:cupin domain-containing protein n=1 Tax=Allopusillimonas ginsengisoli TaxID=453575 RepID=UPI001FD6C701|nr:cupin domain-containing protein [Allopusillimonas ginsengisoli]
MMPEVENHFSERLVGNLEPTKNGSVYVKPQDMEWKQSQFEGIEIKVLYENKEAGELTCLLRWAPGTTLPFHKHPEIEQSYVISGSFSDHDGICRAGEYVYRIPGSLHETHSEEGCTILAIYRKPNIFKNSAGYGVENKKQIRTQHKPKTFEPG